MKKKIYEPVSRSALEAWWLQTFPIPRPANIITIGHVTFSIASPILQKGKTNSII